MKTIRHVRHPNTHSQLFESVTTRTRSTLNLIWKHHLLGSQTLGGTQRNIGDALEMKIGATAIHDNTLLSALFLFKKKTNLHHTVLPSTTLPVQGNATAARIGRHARFSTVWVTKNTYHFLPRQLSLKTGHESCARVFVLTKNIRPWEPPHECARHHASPPSLEDSQDANKKEQLSWMSPHPRHI